jgi:hypothetical protein
LTMKEAHNNQLLTINNKVMGDDRYRASASSEPVLV